MSCYSYFLVCFNTLVNIKYEREILEISERYFWQFIVDNKYVSWVI